MKCLCLLILTAIASASFAGEVRTLDGKSYVGVVALDGSQITISTADRNLRLDPAKLASVTFSPLAGTKAAAPALPTQGHGLKAEFFDDPGFKNLLRARLDPQINFSWPSGIPDPAVPQIFFARWTGQITAPHTGTYTLRLAHDDGARLWIDDKLLIDRWSPGEGLHTASITLQGNQPTPIRIELFNSFNSSRLTLSWTTEDESAGEIVPSSALTPPADYKPDAQPDAQGWFASYYRNKYLVSPVFSRIDTGINFDWRAQMPDPRLDRPFSVCWIANLTPAKTDRYTFSIVGRDGMRVSVDDKIIIDRWNDHQVDGTGTADLTAGKPATVVVSYYNLSGDPTARLEWSSSSFKKQLIPLALLTPATVPQRVHLLKQGGLRGEYFDDQTFKVSRVLRHDPCLDFGWGGDHPPAPGLSDFFAARWTGRLISPGDGQYTLYMDVDDGGRLYLDGKMALDCWTKGFGSYSGPFTFVAGHVYDLKAELTNIGGGASAMRLYWSGPKLPKQIIDPSHYLLPVGDTANDPQVVLKPLPKQFFLTGEPIVLSADASADPGGQLKRVDFVDGNTVIGTADHAPYVFTWKTPPVGHHDIYARTIDDKGYQGLSSRISLIVAAAAPPTFGDNWMDYHVGDTGPAPADAVTAQDGICTISAGPGEVWANNDSFHSVFHALDGDGELTVRIKSLISDHVDNLPSAGITVRENLSPGSRHVSAMLVNSPDTNLFSVHRDVPGGDLDSMGDKTKLPIWLRLERTGSHFTTSSSFDGQRWAIIGQGDLPSAAPLLLGFAVTCKNTGVATLTIDHLTLRLGPRKNTTSTAGVVMRDGSVYAGDILSADPDHVHLRFHAQELQLNTSDVARLLFRPVPEEINESVGPGRTGLMLATGDFIDGDFAAVADSTISISSVLFGKQSQSTSDGTVLAVLLSDPKPARGYSITATDGSIYQISAIKIEANQLQVTGPGGAVNLSSQDLRSIEKTDASPVK